MIRSGPSIHTKPAQTHATANSANPFQFAAFAAALADVVNGSSHSPLITGPNSSNVVPLKRSICICFIGK
jgi:hypothetical protein